MHLPRLTTCQAWARHWGFEDKQNQTAPALTEVNQLYSTNSGNVTKGMRSRKEGPWAMRAQSEGVCPGGSREKFCGEAEGGICWT